MKKALVSLLIMTLFFLAACSDDTPGAAVTQPEGTATEPVNAAATNAAAATGAGTAHTASDADPLSLMGEAMSAKGSYTDQNDYACTYSYALPRLKADTPGAATINDEIDTVFGAVVREQQENMLNGRPLSLVSVAYYGESWKNLLSVVVVGRWSWDTDEYRVYCYDADAGCALDTPAVLNRMGISEQDFLAACKTRFRQLFEKSYKGIPEEQREAYGYDDALARIESEDYVNMNLMVYPDANGELVVLAPIISLTGADDSCYPVNLGLNAAS